MAKKVRRVPYHLDAGNIQELTDDDIALILRGADDLIMSGGRTLLAKILKGSREKRLLELGLDASPVYGVFQDMSLKEVQARIDWVILNGYLAIEYDYRLPLLVYTPRGWEIEKETFASELLAGFDQLLEQAGEDDMTYLKDRNRDMIMLLLDKVAATQNPKYIPLLEAWSKIDYRKVRNRIRRVITALKSGAI